jgi:chorismate synthase
VKIVIMGPKGAGKSSVGVVLSKITGLQTLETDVIIEDIHEKKEGVRLTYREIFAKHGEEYFRTLEREAAEQAALKDWRLIVTGGSIMLDPISRRKLRENSLLVYLVAPIPVLWERAIANGTPPWLSGPDGKHLFEQQITTRDEVLRPFADILIDTTEGSPEELAEQVGSLIAEELMVLTRAANTFGEIIRVTTFGESHGPAIGVVLDGLRPGIEISEEDIQRELDRRRPGQSKIVTHRKESDKAHILSGMFEGKTTGAPLAMVIYNEDQKSGHYDNLRDVFRPGHADFTFYQKYGIRDHRGGGRSSGRETAARVAGGAVAREILARKGVCIVAHAIEVAGIKTETCNYDEIENNPVRCADPNAAKAMEEAILDARKNCDSVGGVIQLEIQGVPPGLGDPVFGKLDARLTSALMTIGATTGIEVGAGFEQTRMRGSQSNDKISDGQFQTNNAGGVLGGISTGQTIIIRIGIKPTSSIAQEQSTMDIHGANQTLLVHGRHDPCIVPRAIPVVESMAALTILDLWEIQARLRPEWAEKWGAPGGAA